MFFPPAADRVTGHARGCAREWACPKLQSMWTRKYGFTVHGNVSFHDRHLVQSLSTGNPLPPLHGLLLGRVFNDALDTFYLQLYGVRHMVKDHSESERRNPLPPRRLLFPIKARDLSYAQSHRQDSTYHGLCYTSRGAMAGTRNSSMDPPRQIDLIDPPRTDPTTHRTMSERSYHGATSRSPY